MSSNGHHLIQRAVVGMLLAIFVGGGFAAATAAWVAKGDYALKIDGVTLPQVAYHRRLSEVRQLMKASPLPEPALRELAINQLIERALLLREAKRRQLSVPESEVETEWQQLLSSTFAGQHERLRDQLQRNHYTSADFRQELRERLLAQKVREALMNQAKVSPADLEAYYKAHPEEFRVPERIEAAHILFKADAAKPAEIAAAKTKAEAVLKELEAGGDFAALAKKQSQDESSKAKGGKLDPFAKGDMHPAFEAAVWKLAPGEIGPAAVKTPYGWHLVQRGKTLPAGLKPLSEARADIEPRLLETNGQQALEQWLKQQRQSAAIEINPAFATSAAPRPAAGTGPAASAAPATGASSAPSLPPSQGDSASSSPQKDSLPSAQPSS